LQAKGGKSYAIALEAYAGHNFPGVHPAHTEGSADGVVYVRKEDRKYSTVELVVERPEVSRFVFGLRALRQLSEVLDPNSLRRGRIIHAFEEIFRVAWARPEETSEETWQQGIAEAMAVIQPLLEQKNGPTAPMMGIVGHSHIDTAWLWTIAETWRKLGRTYSSVLALMDQYPEFKFTQSAAYHYEKARELYPEVFDRVVERVKEGRWEVNGAMYIEPDCNIPSGESFVRQCLVGQRSYREMFGKITDALWQPDVFGYSAALPQILQKSGVKYFLTTKLSWNDTNRFPYDTFWWQGIDGSRVLAHFNEMQGELDPAKLTKLWNDVLHKDVQDRRFCGFGWGDGGGGPMAEMIEMARLCEDLEGCPKTEYTSITEFMNGMESELTSLPTWVGELYLELHRGTLTSIAEIKRLNRKLEFDFRDAEFVWTLAALKGNAYPREDFLEAWKVLLVNQFHDILPGSSIAAVNDQAKAEMSELENRVAEIEGEAHALLAGDID
ncbi:alpha-mannosidase, partial [bacterium]